MNQLYRLLPGVRKDEKPTEVWFGSKCDAVRAYNNAVRAAEAYPEHFSDKTITLETIRLSESTAKLLAATLNGERWDYDTVVMHTHKVVEDD